MATEAKTDFSPKTVDENMFSQVISGTTLTGANPGETITNAAQYRYHYWQVTIAGLSTNVLVRPEGSIDESGAFATLAADGADIEYTADGSYWVTTTRGVRASRVRLRVVSGAATSIGIKYRGGN